MKKALVFLTFIITIVFACTSENKKQLFNTDNIRTQLFSINPQKDNLVKGARGGQFRIPAGAFEGNEPVNIELKEIYSPIEILASGLTTESNGKLLESGGMFYLNAKRNGKELKLLKPIDGSIPAAYINDSMKLFKGEVKSDGNVNWVEPENLSDKPDSNKFCIEGGKILFQQNCASCHDVFKKLTGPALAGADKRLTKQMYFAVVNNPAAFAKRNEYFRCQIKQYGNMMTAFPLFEKSGIECIIKYINNEVSKRPDLKAEMDTIYRGSESCSIPPTSNFPCGVDTFYVDTVPRGNIDFDLPSLHEEAPKEDSADYLYKDPTELEKKMRTKGFGDFLETTNKDRYNFSIKTLGWFNVDAYYYGLEGTSIVDLFADTDFEQESKLELHVFMPAKKLLTVGNYHHEDGIFHFEKYKGQIPLYINDKAVVFAVSSIGEKIYYGITAFTIEKKQTIFIKIKETTEDELKAAFLKMNLDGVDLDVITKKQIIQPNPCNTSDTSKIVIK